MAYLVLSIYVATAFLALYEKYLGKYRMFIYWIIGVILILVAGLREVGIDPDSANYEYTYQNIDNLKSGTVEYSYIFLSQIFSHITSDVHILFFFYAFFGVGLKMFAITKFEKTVFLPLLIYISYYYVTHECMQIRTGILSGIMLLAIIAMGEGEKKRAFMLLLIGSLFHMSALILFPMLFMSNKEMTHKQKMIWGSVIPAGYVLSIMGFAIIMNLPFEIPYVSDKLALYQAATEKGIGDFASVNIFSPLQLATIALFYYLFYFQDTILRYNKFYPILMKLFACGVSAYALFSFFPVFAQRINMLLQAVTIILFADIYHTINPRWASITIISILGLLYLNYSLPDIGLDLFWKV